MIRHWRLDLIDREIWLSCTAEKGEEGAINVTGDMIW